MKARPKVSILCVTYNQERYIGQAIESFLMQKTSFEFEIIVSDDCSADRTPLLIQEYAHVHPDIIQPLLRSKNIGIQNNFIETFKAAKGDYIALCEGDDFWTDPTKLQRQVDFLESHLDYALCFHPVRVFFEGGEEKDFIYPEDKKATKFTVKELLRRNFIQTNSVMYRRQDYQGIPNNILPIDWYLHLFHAQFGNIGFINHVMSAYRRHVGGIWFDNYANVDQLWKKHGISHLALFIEIMKLYGNTNEYRATMYTHISNALSNLGKVKAEGNTDTITEITKKFPHYIPLFLNSQMHVLWDSEKRLEKKKQEAYALVDEIEDAKRVIKKQAHEIELMKASRFWRLRNFVVKHLGGGII